MIVLELGKRDLNRIHGVDVLVYKYYRCSLYEFCQKYNYDESKKVSEDCLQFFIFL